MPEPAIITSRSILMHTSLAYFSPEIQTFDSILHNSVSGKLSIVSERLRLPTELLLLIRYHLLPTVTSHLFNRSTQALSRYESSLRKLLCQDCLSYYQDVYGPDIWGWEQFTGACACRVVKDGHNSGEVEYHKTSEYCDLWSQDQAFPDCSTWLELYLSFESSRLADCQDPFNSIWDVVHEVLREHGCQLLDSGTQSSNHGHFLPFRHIKITIDIPTSVTIVPALSGLEDGVEHCAPVILHRADRDLGLSFAHEKGLEIRRHDGYFYPQPRAHMKSSLTLSSSVESRVAGILAALTTIATAAVSLPLTLATIALTIVCYYSTPHALRIL